MLIMRTMSRYAGVRRPRLISHRGSSIRAVLSLVAAFAVLALMAGCGGDSTQPSADSESDTGRSSAGKTAPQETVQGTTSREGAERAESTVGTVPPELTNSGSAVEGETSGATGSSGSMAKRSKRNASESASASSNGAAKDFSTPEVAQYSVPQDEQGSEARDVANPGDFVASPEDSGGSGYGADSILGVRFGEHEGYERVVVDLGSDGEPTSGLPNWTLSSPTGDGRLKVSFPSVRNTEVSDGSLEKAGAELLESFYVVRGPDGGMFVDFFAERAFYYRVIQLPEPSRIAIDFKPSGSDLALPLPVRGGNTVLTQPRRDTGVTIPMTVSGYSRNPEASNTILLEGPTGETLAQETVRSNDWSSTWGYFETSLEFQPFAGEGTLKVGTRSARDGSFQGVEIPVEQ